MLCFGLPVLHLQVKINLLYKILDTSFLLTQDRAGAAPFFVVPAPAKKGGSGSTTLALSFLHLKGQANLSYIIVQNFGYFFSFNTCKSWSRPFFHGTDSSQKGRLWLHNTADDIGTEFIDLNMQINRPIWAGAVLLQSLQLVSKLRML